MRRLQEIEFTTNCKKFNTALERFLKKYPEAKNAWEDHFEWMHNTETDYWNDREGCGVVTHLDENEDNYYFCIIVYDECQVL